jgi:hypothetical protein
MHSGVWVPATSSKISLLSAASSFKTLVPVYHTAWCHIPEDNLKQVVIPNNLCVCVFVVVCLPFLSGSEVK